MKWSCMGCSPTKCYDELFICIFSSQGGLLGLQISNQIQAHLHILICCLQEMMLTWCCYFQRGRDKLHGAVQRRQQPAAGEARDPRYGRVEADQQGRPRDRGQSPVPGDIEDFIFLRRALNKYFPFLRSVIPAWMSARDGKLTIQRWDMRR